MEHSFLNESESEIYDLIKVEQDELQPTQMDSMSASDAEIDMNDFELLSFDLCFSSELETPPPDHYADILDTILSKLFDLYCDCTSSI